MSSPTSSGIAASSSSVGPGADAEAASLSWNTVGPPFSYSLFQLSTVLGAEPISAASAGAPSPAAARAAADALVSALNFTRLRPPRGAQSPASRTQ